MNRFRINILTRVHKVERAKMRVEPSSSEDLKNDLMLAQEVSFAKALSGNDKRLRDRAVKKLVKWLAIRSRGKTAFTEENFQRIWTGLFYCMWMSDKFLVQEELAESISKLIHCFRNNTNSALLFTKSFYKIMNLEWPGIDQHRIDKFSMLIRRFLRQNLEYCKRSNWDESLAKKLTEVFEKTILNKDTPNGLLMHFIDIFPEEFAKVSRGKVDSEIVVTFVESFIKLMAVSTDSRIPRAISQFFYHLMRQTDVGLEYEEKLNAWKQLGLPSKSPEDLELYKVEDDTVDEDSDLEEMVADSPLDPRAGKVDAILPQIKIDMEAITSLIKSYLHLKSTTSAGRRSLKSLEARFLTLKKGKMPENIAKPDILCENLKKRRRNMNSVKQLMSFTQQLREKELDLDCGEGDSEDALDDNSDGGDSGEILEECETVKADKSGKAENSTNGSNGFHKSNNKKVKRRSRNIKEKGNSPSSPAEEHVVGVVEERNPTSKKSMEERTDKMKGKRRNNETEENENLRPKSLDKEIFKVENVKECDNLVIKPSKKRKLLSSWQVHDLGENSEEYNKIAIPKIIKLETKRNDSLVLTDEEANKELDTVTKPVMQAKLTPTFWERAKEKVLKKSKKSRDSLFLNPFYPGDQSKNSKRISFALDRNETQENEEYLQEVRNSPSIPFDGSRKPVQSVLKSGLSPSPINPFYRFRKLK